MTEQDDVNKAAREGAEEMAKQLKDKGLSFNTWVCRTCEGEPTFDHKEFIEHLKKVHNIDPKTAQGTRTMTMHLDGRDWYQTNYDVVIEGLKFINQVRNERTRNDMMRF